MTSLPRDVEHRNWEKFSGPTATIFHTYHKGDVKFPTEAEIAMTNDPANPRVLLLNWKIKAYGKKTLLVLHREPEKDVVARAGSGMEASPAAIRASGCT